MVQKTVIVTGAARGIGYAIAKKFSEHDYKVVIADINEKKAKNAANEIGKGSTGFHVDVTNEQSVKNLIHEVYQKYGSIDVLVNNAGLQHLDSIENFPLERWNALIGVMLTGPFLTSKYVLPFMKERKFGRIINISSIHGKLASPYKAAYIAAKHGVVGLTRTICLETAKDGITANTIMPGPVKTELLEKQFKQLQEEKGLTQKEALEEIMWPKQPMERFVDPEEIGDAALFLASDGARSISGENISVSGGI